MDLDHERCYRAVASRDARFDGSFYTAVRTTGIYCRPSCPALTPKRVNATFFRTPAAAQREGFRACRRCRPDAVPGSVEWNVRGDLVARAMRLVADGAVERLGVAGLAASLGYSERHLNRLVTQELGAGPLAIARTQRAHTARILLETTPLPAGEVAWAAGFGSIRSFNDTMASVYGQSPTALRARVRPAGAENVRSSDSGAQAVVGPGGGDAAHRPAMPIRVRLAAREPFDPDSILAFLGERALPGLEMWDGAYLPAHVALPHGHATVGVQRAPAASRRSSTSGTCATWRPGWPGSGGCSTSTQTRSRSPRCSATIRCSARSWPRDRGCASPGSVDPHEIVVRAIVGQQVSVAGARTVVGRFVAAHGQGPLRWPIRT